MAHMAFWTVETDDRGISVAFRQGETVQDCGILPHAETDQFMAWIFHSDQGAQQFDYIQAPFCKGWVLEPNLEFN